MVDKISIISIVLIINTILIEKTTEFWFGLRTHWVLNWDSLILDCIKLTLLLLQAPKSVKVEYAFRIYGKFPSVYYYLAQRGC